MSALDWTTTRLIDGVWEGVIAGMSQPPTLEAQHLGKPLSDAVDVQPHGEGAWVVRVTLPSDVLSDGAHTVLLQNVEGGETLDAIHVIAGAPLDHELRAEVQLLREELDMLKRAFRRHCIETS
ncbi:hypothetical protein [Primorskyibacter sp. S187A]|uniref:hypothetical protein n=1 Tax=Primorskyibacter sp. S187A TaxID=3415130 RepID=UPI003C7A548E